MAIGGLDHYTINVTDVDKTVAFYTDALGLTRGKRPPFTFPGAWLYCGDKPVVHLIGGSPGNGQETNKGTGAIDHIAFQGSGVAAFTARLASLGIEFRERDVPATKLHQVFVEDPDGVSIEINFRGEAQTA